MLHFIVLWDNKDITTQISSICKFKTLGHKKTILYLPKAMWNGYGGEFIPINPMNFVQKLINMGERENYNPGNFIIVKELDPLRKLLPALHKSENVGCVIGMLENLLRYMYISKERSYQNSSKNGKRHVRQDLEKKLIGARLDVLSELSIMMPAEDFPVVLLWFGYAFKYKHKEIRKVYLYNFIRELGKIHNI